MVWNFILYLLYGLAFFTLGAAILSRDIRLSELGIARILWLLSAFGISHGFHEWMELLKQIAPEVKTAGFELFQLILVSISYLFLLYFGIFLNIISSRDHHTLKNIPKSIKALVGLTALSLTSLVLYIDYGSGTDIHIRLFIAFPAGLMSGIGLILYSKTIRQISRNGSINFIIVGSLMCCYSLAAGIVSTHKTLPILGIDIVVLRGLCAFLMTFFTIRALYVFNLEQREIINERLLRFSQSEKLASMGILAAGIAHEINNPLTNVLLNVEMLRDKVGDHTDILKKLDAISRNTERASRIARELLDFSRESETDLQPIDINETIKSTLRLLRSQKLYGIIHLNLQKVPKVAALPWKMEEVILNVLMNSLDACCEEDIIEVETQLKNNHVVITFSDTGPGIDEKDLHKIFDPFFTTKEIGKGTGLGLSICYNIIKKHHGEIYIQSSEIGGTLVTVKLPVIKDEK